MSNKTWMSNLEGELRDMPIIYLAIPGSHNSMTYGIDSHSKISPDAEPTIRRLNILFPWFVRRWCKNQDANIQKQLELGVRYFDLRVAQQHDKFYFSHGLFSMEIDEPLHQIKDFANENPGEVVILDFQHFYNVEFYHHVELHKRFLRLFGKSLYATTDGSLSECTLNRCRSLERNIILIYRRSPILLPFEFWPGKAWPTPWPNLSSVKALENYLGTALLTRKPFNGYVSQCILTPSSFYIAKRFLSSLEQTAKTVKKKLQPWIAMQCPGSFKDSQSTKVNVFIADFVDLNEGEFCQWVISLNRKLCEVCETNNNVEPEAINSEWEPVALESDL